MVRVWGTGGRRVLGLALAGLVPAALVTLLLVSQPSIADRRVFPLLRLPLTVVALGLALAAVVSWVAARDRLSRPALTGLAWVGVTTLLCIGPLLESSPRPRLYALDLETHDVAWARTSASADPALCGDDLVVSDPHTGRLIGLDPATGSERWDAPATNGGPPASCRVAKVERVVEQRPILFPGEQVVTVAWFGDRAYAYVATPAPGERSAGAIAALDLAGAVLWRVPLPPAVASDEPAIEANARVVVVAGGERVGVFDVGEDHRGWTVSVVTLGKSRRYALPGAVQRIILTDRRVFLSLATE